MSGALQDQYVATNGVTLHLVQAGSDRDPLVILLHGFPEFWFGWRHQIDFLARAGFRVWAPDQRGYNLSEKPKGVAAYSIDELAADVNGLVAAAGRDKAAIIGHDWGAAVAWWMALRFPERVERLCVINVPHPMVMRRHLRRSLAQMFKSWYMFFFQVPWLPEACMRMGSWRAAARALEGTSRPGTFKPADLEKYRQAWSQPDAMKSMIHWYRALFRAKPKPVASPRVSVPTLILWGAKDAFLGREMAPPSAELCDRGELVFIEEATHWVQHEEPERVNQLLEGFLEGRT